VLRVVISRLIVEDPDVGSFRQDSQFAIHAKTPDYSILSYGPCLCQIAHSAFFNAAAWNTSARVAERLASQFAGKLSVLTIMEELPGAPTARQRADAEDYALTVERLVARSVVVVESGGFRSALIRSVITGMAVLGRKKYPRRVFDNVTGGVLWLSAGAEPALDAGDFLAALDQVRQSLRRRDEVA
jgi:hypothetical protein